MKRNRKTRAWKTHDWKFYYIWLLEIHNKNGTSSITEKNYNVFVGFETRKITVWPPGDKLVDNIYNGNYFSLTKKKKMDRQSERTGTRGITK